MPLHDPFDDRAGVVVEAAGDPQRGHDPLSAAVVEHSRELFEPFGYEFVRQSELSDPLLNLLRATLDRCDLDAPLGRVLAHPRFEHHGHDPLGTELVDLIDDPKRPFDVGDP